MLGFSTHCPPRRRRKVTSGTRSPLPRGACPALLSSMLRPSRACSGARAPAAARSEEHTSELQSLMRISYAVFCLKKKKTLTSKYYVHPHTSAQPQRQTISKKATYQNTNLKSST